MFVRPLRSALLVSLCLESRSAYGSAVLGLGANCCVSVLPSSSMERTRTRARRRDRFEYRRVAEVEEAERETDELVRVADDGDIETAAESELPTPGAEISDPGAASYAMAVAGIGYRGQQGLAANRAERSPDGRS